MTRQVVVDMRFESTPAKVVWKYNLPLSGEPQQINIPVESRLLHVEYIDLSYELREFQLWYEVTLGVTEESYRERVFQVFGTGDESIPKSAKHVHTGIDWNEGHRNTRTTPRYVWHLYEYPSGAQLVEKISGIV
jgi:hypothetical protein